MIFIARSEEERQVLECRHLTYGGVNALEASQQLEDVSFSVAPGEVVLLRYDSAEEYALLKAIIKGEQDPISGEMIWQGHPYTLWQKRKEWSQISSGMRWVTTQSVVRELTVRGNLQVVTYLNEQQRQEQKGQAALLEAWGLTPLLDTKVAALDEREVWKISLLQAMMLKSELIVIEQWPKGLTAKAVHKIHGLIEKWAAEHDTGVLIASAHFPTGMEGDALLLVHGTISNTHPASAFEGKAYTVSTNNQISLDNNLHVRFVSDQAALLLGRSAGDFFDKPFDQVIQLYDEDRVPWGLALFIEKEKHKPNPKTHIQTEVFITAGIKSERFVKMEVQLNNITSGNMTVDLLFEDITDKTELDRVKFDFAAITGHELRTPLTSILGNLQLLEMSIEDKLNGQEKEMLLAIELSAKRLENLVHNLLRLSRSESDTDRALDYREEDWATLIKTTVRPYQSLALAKKITVMFKSDDNQSVKVACDRMRIGEAVENYLVNAIEHTPEGGSITVTASVDAKRNSVRCLVEDTGKGIPKEAQAHLFTLFYRTRRENDLTDMHLGLGLHITKHIIEEHGGDVWVESKVGEGSTFGFWIPIKS